MPKLLDSKTFIQFFELDKDNETASLSDEATDKWLLWKQFDFTESLRKWAEEKYPNAPHLYHCCFAGLIAYFATGAYGGYGTEYVQKERFAEHKAYEFYTRLHKVLSPEEMTHLIDSLFQSPDCNYTPDGRPVFVILREEELERMFR